MTVKVYDRYNVRRPSPGGLVCGPGLTQNEHARDCDINVIMDKYLRTGTVAQRTDMGRFGDFSEDVDFHAAQNVIAKSREQFSALSAKVRERFGNDPAKFLGWVHAPGRKADDFEAIGMDMSVDYVNGKKAAEAAAGAAVVPPVVAK
ncbi:MAG: DNA pilot protein [Microviridae sp.]|nr:MAG: DNA pilot protein [Microviridae sp.]